MQEVTIVTKIDNSQAVSAQVGLRKEIKNLKLELEGLDEGTKEYNSTFMKLSNLMKEQKDRMNALRNSSADLGDVIGNTTKLAAGIAGGFQAAQGAMALFGIESEDLQKALLRVQAFSAIAQGLGQLEELTKVIPNLVNNVKGYFNQISEGSKAIQATGKVASDSIAASSSNIISSNTAVAGSTTAVAGSINTVSDAYSKEVVNIQGSMLAKRAEIQTNLNLAKSELDLNASRILNNDLINNLTGGVEDFTAENEKLFNKNIDLSKQITSLEGKLEVATRQIEEYGNITVAASGATEEASKSSGKFVTGLKSIATGA